MQAPADWLNGRSYHGFWRGVFGALLLAAAVFVVLKLAQVDLTGAFGRAPRRAALDYDAAAGGHSRRWTLTPAWPRPKPPATTGWPCAWANLQLLKTLTDRRPHPLAARQNQPRLPGRAAGRGAAPGVPRNHAAVRVRVAR
ncbi:MAG: hypothetical protein WKG07_13985 [Hymenobacter sp.]